MCSFATAVRLVFVIVNLLIHKIISSGYYCGFLPLPFYDLDISVDNLADDGQKHSLIFAWQIDTELLREMGPVDSEVSIDLFLEHIESVFKFKAFEKFLY